MQNEDKKFFDKYPDQVYSCISCTPLVKKAVVNFHHLDQKVKELEDRVDGIDTKVTTIQSTVDSTKNDVTDIKKKIIFESKADFEKAVDEKIEIEAAGIKADAIESYVRRNRVIIMGFKVFSDELDQDWLKKLWEALELGDLEIVNHFRLRKDQDSASSDNRNIPNLIVEFAKNADKNLFGQKAIRDKIDKLTGDFAGIKIQPDRTYRERMEYKKMRGIQDQKNLELRNTNVLDQKFTIKKGRLVLTKVQQE